MSAYLVIDAEIFNVEIAAGDYRELAEASIALYGGQYHIQATVPEVKSGTWDPSRIMTIIEFRDMDRLKEWYGSPEYQKALAVREGSMEIRELFVEGVPR